jgi:hypothetical protein
MTGCNFTILTFFALQLEGSELEPALVNLELGLFSDAFFSSGIVLIIESLELEHFRSSSVLFLLPSLIFAFLSLCFEVAESELDLILLRVKVNWKKTDVQ